MTRNNNDTTLLAWTTAATTEASEWSNAVLSDDKPAVWAVATGTIFFGSTLACSTLMQQRLLHISTATMGPIPSVLGFFTVCMASVAAHKAALIAYQHQEQQHLHLSNHQHWYSSSNKDSWNLQHHWENGMAQVQQLPQLAGQFCREMSSAFSVTKNDHGDILNLAPMFQTPLHTVRIAALGFLAFKALGGRCWAIAPSSFTHLGSFARRSLSAGETYATPAQRTALERLGRLVGCHTCGTRHLFSLNQKVKFVGDHMPPKSLAAKMNRAWYRRWLGWRKVQYRFYPQCTGCSSIQGGLLSKAANQGHKRPWAGPSLARLRANSHFHGFRPRLGHLAGGLVGGTAVHGASSTWPTTETERVVASLEDKNRQRYRNCHADVVSYGQGIYRTTMELVGLKPPSRGW
mmetsp:Transcript_6041/g.13264  ORF Transcript_6041/g.13264 Transcript_6041/m.13264 type:complete len:404 (-) Transcript_6041:119-1330(-)